MPSPIEDFLLQLALSTERDTEKIQRDYDERVRAAVDEFDSRLRAHGDEVRASDLAFIEQQVRDSVEQAALGVVRREIEQHAVDAVREIAAFEGQTPQPALVSRLQTLVDLQTGFLDTIAPGAQDAVRRSLSSAISQPIPVLDVVRTFRDQVEGQAAANARAIIETSMNAVDREAARGLAEAAGADLCVYTGPTDRFVRFWCDKMVDRAFRISDLLPCSNGYPELGDVLVHGGGWNCRHRFIFVSRAVLERYYPGALVVDPQYREAVISRNKKTGFVRVCVYIARPTTPAP